MAASSPLRRLSTRLAAGYGLTCALLWPIPVLGLLHAESSAVVAAVGCGLAATTSRTAWRGGAGLWPVLGVQLVALLIPLAMLTASLVWRPNCGYLQGLGLFALLAPPSVLFGVGVAWAAPSRWPAWLLIVGLVLAAIGGVLLDLLLHPQLFTYSHVFGGVLGPIYDAELAVRPGLWAAKGQTLAWAALLLSFGTWRRRHQGGVLVVALAAAVAGSYAAAPTLGIVQTASGISSMLSERIDLGPVVLHVAPETSSATRMRLADEVLYRFETLSDALGVRPGDAVEVYLYPDPDTKAALIGSRQTSVVPVWLRTPQIHMLADEVPRSLGHEMVHVLAREFGMPVVRASPAIGLVEGLAVALEPPDALPDASALVRAAMALPADQGGVSDPGAAVRATMSLRFWSARAGVAYTVNGAFAGWLLDTYGAAPMRAAYRTGRFEGAYGQSLDALSRAWADDLAMQPLDPEALAVSRWLFSRPSLFEVRCPHHLPDAVRFAREARDAWERGDLALAAKLYESATAADSLSLSALAGRLETRLAAGAAADSSDVRAAAVLADSLPTSATLTHLADVRRLLGLRADGVYRAARDSLAPVDAVGRVLLDRRRRLASAELSATLAAAPDSVADGMDPVLAALVHSGADRPSEAWEVARRWCVPDSGEAGRTLRWLQARLASRVGAFDRADQLFDGVADAFERDGPRSIADAVRDDRRRLAWRRALVRPPAILSIFPPATDDLAPDCPAAGSARGRVLDP